VLQGFHCLGHDVDRRVDLVLHRGCRGLVQPAQQGEQH
jgi:hypothetical protein